MSYITSGLFPTRRQPSEADCSRLRRTRLIRDGSAGVLSFDYWTRVIGGDSAIIGRRLTVSGNCLCRGWDRAGRVSGSRSQPVDLSGSAQRPGAEQRGPVGVGDEQRFAILIAAGSSRSGPKSRSCLDPTQRAVRRVATRLCVHGADRVGAAARGARVAIARPIRDRSVSLAMLARCRGAVGSLGDRAERCRTLPHARGSSSSRNRCPNWLSGCLACASRRSSSSRAWCWPPSRGLRPFVVGWWGSTILRTTLLSTIRWPASGIDRRIVIMAAVLAVAIGLAAGLFPCLRRARRLARTR